MNTWLTYRLHNALNLGFCYDVWEKASKDINISLEWIVTDGYEEMMKLFQDQKIDVVAERMDVASTKMLNLSK